MKIDKRILVGGIGGVLAVATIVTVSVVAYRYSHKEDAPASTLPSSNSTPSTSPGGIGRGKPPGSSPQSSSTASDDLVVDPEIPLTKKPTKRNDHGKRANSKESANPPSPTTSSKPPIRTTLEHNEGVVVNAVQTMTPDPPVTKPHPFLKLNSNNPDDTSTVNNGRNANGSSGATVNLDPPPSPGRQSTPPAPDVLNQLPDFRVPDVSIHARSSNAAPPPSPNPAAVTGDKKEEEDDDDSDDGVDNDSDDDDDSDMDTSEEEPKRGKEEIKRGKTSRGQGQTRRRMDEAHNSALNDVNRRIRVRRRLFESVVQADDNDADDDAEDASEEGEVGKPTKNGAREAVSSDDDNKEEGESEDEGEENAADLPTRSLVHSQDGNRPKHIRLPALFLFLYGADEHVALGNYKFQVRRRGLLEANVQRDKLEQATHFAIKQSPTKNVVGPLALLAPSHPRAVRCVLSSPHTWLYRESLTDRTPLVQNAFHVYWSLAQDEEGPQVAASDDEQVAEPAVHDEDLTAARIIDVSAEDNATGSSGTIAAAPAVRLDEIANT